MAEGTAAVMSSPLLSTSEVLDRLGISETTLWRLEKRGEFPQAVRLSRQCKRWRPADIDAYIDGKIGAA